MVELTFSWRRSNASCDGSLYRRKMNEARLMPQFRQEVEIESRKAFLFYLVDTDVKY